MTKKKKKRKGKKGKAGASLKGRCLGEHSALECTHSPNIPEFNLARLPSLREAASQSRKRNPHRCPEQTDQSSQGSIVCGSAGSAWDHDGSLLEQTTVHLTASHPVLLGNSHFQGSRSRRNLVSPSRLPLALKAGARTFTTDCLALLLPESPPQCFDGCFWDWWLPNLSYTPTLVPTTFTGLGV